MFSKAQDIACSTKTNVEGNPDWTMHPEDMVFNSYF